MRRVLDWLDERTAYRSAVSSFVDEPIKGGARYAYALGMTLLVMFIAQMITGVLLMLTYAPSTHDAWSSVYYVQYKVGLGWFVRGMHHWGASAVMITMGLHLLQVTIYGAYRKPREVNWWLGLVLMQLIVFLGISGYLLPWDMKGYWATTVATNIAGSMPVIGPKLRDLVVGGPQYGQATLTRIYTAHVAVLPLLVLMVIALHYGLRKKHGVTPPAGADLAVTQKYFPSQFMRDISLSLFAVFAVAGVTIAFHGAPLDAPADPTVDYPPRPEWYFLWLYQLLNLVPGKLEFLVTLGIPGVLGGFLAALPLIDRAGTNRVRDRIKWVAPVVFAAAGVVGLTAMAMRKDHYDPKYQAERRTADSRAARTVALASNGIDPGGPLEMLRKDPLTRGRDLYFEHCTGCHTLSDEGRLVGESHGPDHTGFASRAWMIQFLNTPQSARFFGNTEHDSMPSQRRLGDVSIRAITEFLYEEGREPLDSPGDATSVTRGKALFESKCMGCHTYAGDGDFGGMGGPDLTTYASRTWIYRQITDPKRHYPENSEMPAYEAELSEHDRWMLAGFLRQQRFTPKGGSR